MVRRPGVHAVVVYRFGSWLLGAPLPLRILLGPIYFLLERRMRAKWGIHVDRRARIGGGFFIEHFGGVFVGHAAAIGENFTIYHDVTLGEIQAGRRKGQPILGANVTIYSGAKIMGKVRIGNNAAIGNNVVVQRDVPDNALVQLQPPMVVRFPSRYGQNALSSEHADP